MLSVQKRLTVTICTISAQNHNEIVEDPGKSKEEVERETLLLRPMSKTPKILERRLSQPAEHVYHYEHVKELFPEADLIVEEDPNRKPDPEEKMFDWSKG